MIPARELLGNLLLQLDEPAQALKAFEATLKSHPNRFNTLYGAGLAAEKCGNKEKATLYFGKLLAITGKAATRKMEIAQAREFLRQ